MQATLKAKLKYARAAVRSASAYAALTGATLFMSVNANAASTQLKDVFKNLTGNVEAGKIFLLTLASLCGVGLFMYGLFLFHKNSQQPGQDHAKKGFIACGIGIALLIIPFLIGVGAESLSSGQADTATQAIENDAKF